MNRTKKLICLAVLMVLLLTSVVTLAACSGAKEAISGYMPSFAGKSVKDDFELPRTIGDNVKVKWTSSDSDAIEVVNRGSNENYLAKVKLGSTVKSVTLTVSATGAGSKDFTVNVQALNATLIASEYQFKYDRAEVSADFDLPATAEVRGVTATITWSVDAKYSEWLEVKGGRCLISVPSETTRVEINATFEYNGTKATMPYTFYVSQPKTHREEIYNWYQNTNITRSEIKGYVVGIATAFSDSYKNVSMYVVDEDMCSGIYLFRCSGSVEDGAKLVPGVHVTISGATSTDYSGLWETTNSSTFVVDDDLPSKDISELVYALDNDATSGSLSLKWHTGSLASLTNWTVKSVESSFSSKAGTMMTLTKDGAEIAVAYSNYMEGFYTSTDSAPAASQFGLANYKEGDVVSVTGIVSYHSGFQLLPRSAADIKKGTADANPTDGSKVKAAIAEVESKLVGIDGLITSSKTLDLPTTSNGVNITYTKTFDGDSVAISGGKVTVTPKDKLQNITVEVEYKVGSYTTWSYFTLRSQNLDDQGKVDFVAEQLGAATIDQVKQTGDVKLPEVETLGTTIVWSVKGEKPDWITVSGSTVTVNELPAEDTTLTLIATVTLNGKSSTAELALSVRAGETKSFKAIDAPAAGDYILALYQGNEKFDKWLFSNGEISSNDSGDFGATTDNVADAAVFTIAASGDGWTIQLKSSGKFLELNDNHRWTYVDKATSVWNWNEEAKVFTFDVSGTTYYLGTYGTYDTISASTIDRITGSNLGSTSQFPAYFGSMVDASVATGIEPGDYTIKLQDDDQVWYVTDQLTSKGELTVSTNESDAAVFSIVIENGVYYIKVGEKYLEAYLNGSYKNLRLSDSKQNDAKVWKWNAEYGTFTVEYDTETRFLGANYKTDSTSELYDNAFLLSDIKYVNSSTQVKPQYIKAQSSAHKHVLDYKHDANAWTHTEKCTDPACPDHYEKQVACTPVDNVCSKCNNEYTSAQIVARLFALTSSGSLPGSYKLTGVVSSIEKSAYTYSEQWEIDVNITVEGQTIYCYGVKASEAEVKAIKEGDTITVSGELKLYKSDSKEVYEFNLPNLVSRSDGSGGQVTPPPAQHVCGHKCPTCGKCLDATCQDPVCANNRCPGHTVTPGGQTAPAKPTGTPILQVLSTNVEKTVADGSGYAAYAGDHTIGSYTVNFTDIMVNTLTSPDEGCVQFKKTSGLMKVTGKFDSLYIVCYCTKEYADGFIKVTVGGNEVTAIVGVSEAGDYKDSFSNTLYKITILVTLNMTEAKEVQIQASSIGAFYTTDFSFYGTSSGGTTPGGDGGGDVGGGDEPVDKAPLDTDFNTTGFAELTEKATAGDDGKFYVIGYVKTISNAYNSTIVLEDAEGKTFQIYGVFNEDGTTRNQSPNSTLKEGDVVVFYGSVTTYNGTAQMANAWLVQVGTEAKTNVAGIYLAELDIPQEVRANFTLPEGVTWTVKSGKGIVVSGTSATVTRTTEAQTVVLMGSYSIGGKDATRDYTVVVRAKLESGETIVIDFKETGKGLHGIIGAGTNTTATFTMDSLALQCYNCKRGTASTEYNYLMLNKSTTCYLANKEAIPGYITKIEVLVPAKSSGSAKYHVSLSKTAMLEHKTIETPTNGNNSADTTITVTGTLEDQFQFFNISAESANGQVAKIVITYTEA